LDLLERFPYLCEDNSDNVKFQFRNPYITKATIFERHIAADTVTDLLNAI